MFEILKDRDGEILTEGVLEVLERLGMSCENKQILQALRNRGAIIDYKEGRAKFPRRIVQEFVEEIKKEEKAKWDEEIKGENKKTLYSGYIPPVSTSSKFEAPYTPHIFHPLAVYYYDDEKKEKRKGKRDDFINLTKLGDVLHPEMGVGHSLILSDVPSVIEPLEAALLLLEYAHKPRGVYVQDVRQIDYLLEIEEVAGIKDPYWYWLANVGFATPLKLGKDIAERFLYMVKTGMYPAKVYSMGVSGVNMPVTTAGSIVVTTAEFIALWISARSLNPKIPLTGQVLSGTMDMRTGEVNFSSFDALIRRLSVSEFIRKWTGISISPGVGEYTSSRLPGLYTALEKAYVAMTIAAFTGYHPEVGIGGIEGGLTLSPVQLLLDREITKGLKFLENPRIDRESIALETILDIGFGKEKNYLDSEHTLKYFRNSLWNPEFFDRIGWSPENEEKILNKAKNRVKQIIGEYKKPEVDPGVISKVKEIIEKARKELLENLRGRLHEQI